MFQTCGAQIHKLPLAQRQVFKGHPLCVLKAPAGLGSMDPQESARLGHTLPQTLAGQMSARMLAHTPAEFGILHLLKGGMGALFQGKQHQQGRRVQKWCQHLHPWREFQQTLALLADALRLASEFLSHMV